MRLNYAFRNKIKINACVIVVVVTGFIFSSSVKGQGLAFSASIALSETAAVGQVSTVDRHTDGRLLVVDHIGNSVFVFHGDGTLVSELDPSGCNIGYRFRPIYARFVGDDVMVVNSDPSGLRFDSQGRCLSKYSPEFEAPAQVAFTDEGLMYGYYPWSASVQAYSSSGSLVASLPALPFRFPNAASRIEGGGIAIIGDELFVAEPVGLEVFVLSLDGHFIRSISLAPLGLTVPPTDLQLDPGPNFVAEAARLLEQSSWILMIAEAARGLLFVHYRHSDGTRGIALFDTAGNLMVNDSNFQDPIVYVGNSVVLTLYQPDVDENGTLPNPRLNVYRLSP